MSQLFMTPLWLIYCIMGFFILLMVLVIYAFFQLMKHNKKDVLIFIDKTNRFQIVYDNVKNVEKYTRGKGTYILQEESGLLNSKGKALYVFSENNPQPLKLEFKKAEWLDAESLMATINNELIKLMVNPTDSVKDMMIMLGAIGGMVAGLTGVVVLLIQTGVITP